ncbi:MULTISPECIES: MCE family protein [unclassified Gordonia (in: high G+C Gram-positive bacteria)]|uniref:MCE family protein n=1 Tax=unclassified Gordonia (in: high G+C Gram-positive bacteria) TaxID=2657482 RepID=UPI001FFF949B|nr:MULTISPECIES: MCE family protein [unclassified Gordonia (in: high G+C Gram-positive bacteria)]UQE77068.1 MCE family protein [Gordonia sp. PP30]
MRVDTGGRDPSVAQYFWRGVAFLAVAAVVFVLLMMRYEGKFDSVTRVTAQMTDVGDGLINGADVRYNGFIVGAVRSVSVVNDGDAGPLKDVSIDLLPAQAKGIPLNTEARTVPANLFGVNSVELIQPANPSSQRLHSGATIKAATDADTIRLQDAQNDLRHLLQAVPAEDLGMVLGTIADALHGGGATFKTFLPVLDTYFQQINAQFPAGAPSGFANFNAAVTGISQSAPKLLDTLGKSVIPAMTIAEKQRDLTALLSAGQGLLDQTQSLFAKNGDGGERIVGDLNTMLGATMADPQAMPEAVHELYVLAGRVLGVFTGTNGKVQLNLGISFSPFEMYTRQNCPVYNGGKYGQLRGPGCVGPGTGTGPTSSGPLAIYPAEGLQRRTVSKRVTTGHDGQTLGAALGRKPTAADTLMLGPLVQGVTPQGGDK